MSCRNSEEDDRPKRTSNVDNRNPLRRGGATAYCSHEQATSLLEKDVTSRHGATADLNCSETSYTKRKSQDHKHNNSSPKSFYHLPKNTAPTAEAQNADNASCGSSYTNSTQSIPLTGFKISYDMTPFSSTMSSLCPVCRICHTAAEQDNILISPCRCNGSLKHVHGTCLRKWIEMRAKRNKTEYSSKCELCGYIYKKRKFIRCTEWRLPKMNVRDKILHTIFMISLTVMVVCAVVTVQCLVTDTAEAGATKYRSPDGVKSQMSLAELTTLTCGIIFFVTFIIAMTVEIKAKHTIYEVLRRVIRYNTVWYIENYDKNYDTQPVHNQPSK